MFLRKFKRPFLFLVLLLQLLLDLSSAGLVYAQTPVENEYELKSAFVFNFLKYIEQPPGTSSSKDLRLCIFGGEELSPFNTLKGKAPRDVQIEIISNRQDAIVGKCNVIFISATVGEKELSILNSFKGNGILTIGESPEFCRHGGMISFFQDNQRIRFEINITTTKQASINVSSKLLQLAKILKE